MDSRLFGVGSTQLLVSVLLCILLAGASGAEPEGAERVALEGPAVLATPDGESVPVAAGEYAVRASGASDLALVPVTGGDALVIGAEPRRHDQDLSHPVALSIAGEGEDAGARHIVLMLPGGELREAIGSDGEVATRGALRPIRAGALGKPTRRKLQRLRPKLKFRPRPKAKAPATAKTPVRVKRPVKGSAPLRKPPVARTEGQAVTDAGTAQTADVPVPNLRAETRIVPGTRYRITNEFLGDGKALDVPGDARDEVYMADTGNFSGQSWKLTPWDGYYRLTNEFLGDGKSLDVVNDGSGQLTMADSGNYSGQSWKLTPFGDGYFRLTTEFLGEGKSLDVIEDDDESRELILADSEEMNGQSWKLSRFGGSGTPPTGGRCVWTSMDVVDRRIDEPGAQQSLMRKLRMSSPPHVRAEGSAMLGAIKNGTLEAIFKSFRPAVVSRAAMLGKNPHALVPPGQNGTCITAPPGERPLIVYRTNLRPDQIDAALSRAWAECGLPTPLPPCEYQVVLKPKPITPSDADLTVFTTRGGAKASTIKVRVIGPGFDETKLTDAADGAADFGPLEPGTYAITADGCNISKGFGARTVEIERGSGTAVTVPLLDACKDRPRQECPAGTIPDGDICRLPNPGEVVRPCSDQEMHNAFQRQVGFCNGLYEATQQHCNLGIDVCSLIPGGAVLCPAYEGIFGKPIPNTKHPACGLSKAAFMERCIVSTVVGESKNMSCNPGSEADIRQKYQGWPDRPR